MIIPLYLVNEHFNDRYFDVVDALDEAQQVFFINNDLIGRTTTAAGSGNPLVIGETGFGAGRTVVSLMEYLAKSGLRDVSITYCSVELYPLSPERMRAILNGFKDRVGDEINTLMEAYRAVDLMVPGWHGPKKNPEMWRPELLMAIGEKTRAGGGCATFTVAGEVRRGLAEAGFRVKKLPGCGGKKEVLQGIKA
jgi:tRNA U34 5-methylaminomethyl-2-thiouridine-forming methyltransferase MnmC